MRDDDTNTGAHALYIMGLSIVLSGGVVGILLLIQHFNQ